MSSVKLNQVRVWLDDVYVCFKVVFVGTEQVMCRELDNTEFSMSIEECNVKTIPKNLIKKIYKKPTNKRKGQ